MSGVCLDGNDDWSPLAAEWAARWGGIAHPARLALLDAAGVGPTTRLLDAGCGSGELLRLASERGAVVAGCDPSPAMLAIAARSTPQSDLRQGGIETLPWPDSAFDVVTAVNALQFADDETVALREVRRVLAPRGLLGVAGWAERELNDIDVLEAAVAEADGEPLPSDPPMRQEGGLQALLAAAGFEVVAAGVVETPWSVPDGDALVAGVLLGEDETTLADLRSVLLHAARPFRTADGGYRLLNHFRWAVGRC
jgi:SAM-dependent methyltransferase